MLTRKQSKKLLEMSMLIRKILKRQNLTKNESKKLMLYILKGYGYKTNQSSLGAFLAGLYIKGPTIDEILGALEAIGNYERFKELRVTNMKVTTIVGSGKDEFKTFNISTVASFIAAGSGVPVAKVGCRAETSIAGVTDVLELLGININCSFRRMLQSLRDNNIGFFNPELKLEGLFKHYIGKVNFFNPLEYGLAIYTGIRVRHILFGISDLKTEISASILKKYGFGHSMVVCGMTNRGLLFDEISNLNKTKISELHKSKIRNYYIYPEMFKIKRAKDSEIAQGKSVKENAKIILNILSGKDKSARRDIVLLNAAGLIYIGGKAKNLTDAFELATNSLEEGRAMESFEKLRIYSQGNLKKII